MHPEPENTAIKHKTARLLTDAVFYLAILFFAIGFNFSDRMAGNWYQQFMPFPAGGQVRDIYFVDSLLGFAVTDSSIIKTVNGGDNWSVKQTGYYIFNRIKFLNVNTGFVSGGNNTLLKTINSGENWTPIILPSIYPFDMSVISEDSIWLVNTNGLTGGVFRTTNGGASWQQQLNLGSSNPEKVYMFNSRIGYISKNQGSAGYVRKTTDSGNSWSLIVNNDYFIKIHFTDSLTGWKSSAFGFKKTIDGGISWVIKTLPSGGYIQTNPGLSFSVVNKDTIWSSGGYLLYPNNTVHGFLNRSTDGGETWYYQIPDTALGYIGGFVNFVDKNHGWSINTSMGIHTTTGGDPVWITAIEQTSSEVPKEFKLYQNYPNPFNPVTNIGFRISVFGLVTLKIFDITGKEVITLINEELRTGEYRIDWNASGYSSGVYFYKLSVTAGKEVFTETKKMMLIK